MKLIRKAEIAKKKEVDYSNKTTYFQQELKRLIIEKRIRHSKED